MGSRSQISVGTLLYCDPFPDWTNAVGVSAHFVVVLRTWDNGNLMLAPITTKGDRCRQSVELRFNDFRSFFTTKDTLTVENCHLCLRNDRGDTTVYTWAADRSTLRPTNGPSITIDRRACLTAAEFDFLLSRLPENLRRIVKPD